VCTMSENIPELLYPIMAITNIGGLWVPINSLMVGESLKYIIEASDAKHVCTSEKYAESVNEVLPNVKKPVQSLPLTELLEKAKNKSSEYESSIKPDDLSMIIFTSGTTGFPKGGAIALGHPVRNSWCRLIVTCLHEVERTG
jgi:acyl-coenzyme A synthetase/AMP-(fatty) acid ligase